jgi:hypothetical protein
VHTVPIAVELQADSRDLVLMIASYGGCRSLRRYMAISFLVANGEIIRTHHCLIWAADEMSLLAQELGYPGEWQRAAALLRPLRLSSHQGLDLLQLVGQFSTGQLGVVGGLGPQPVARTEAQKPAETQIGVGGDRPLAR